MSPLITSIGRACLSCRGISSPYSCTMCDLCSGFHLAHTCITPYKHGLYPSMEWWFLVQFLCSHIFCDFGRMKIFCFRETRDPILITIRAWVFIAIYLLLVIQQGLFNIVLVHLFHHVFSQERRSVRLRSCFMQLLNIYRVGKKPRLP